MRGSEQSEGARKSSISGSRPMSISLHSYDTPLSASIQIAYFFLYVP